MIREGRVWTFGDDINTDLIFPNRAFNVSVEEQLKLVFSANRPGWVEQVREGDFIVAGENFGMGSGRAIGKMFTAIGIRGAVASSFNGLGFKNCIMWGLPALTVPRIGDHVQEGEVLRVDFAAGAVTNVDTGWSTTVAGLPDLLIGIAGAGGMVKLLAAEGLVELPA